jgi:hypothetical protein
MVRTFAARYSARVHSLLVGWNLIVGFWIGSQQFRDEVAALQRALHLPTWTLALLTGLINITLAYRAWNKQR